MVGVWEEQSRSFFVQRHDLVEKLKELACVREDKTSFQNRHFKLCLQQTPALLLELKLSQLMTNSGSIISFFNLLSSSLVSSCNDEQADLKSLC